MITSQYHQKKILKYDHVAISSEEFSPHHRSDSNVSAFFINWEYWREEDRSNGNLFWKLLSWRTAMKGSASKLLRAYIFFTAIAIILSLVPLMSGQDTGKVNAICHTLCVLSALGQKLETSFLNSVCNLV
jgi:hypothetical protein